MEPAFRGGSRAEVLNLVVVDRGPRIRGINPTVYTVYAAYVRILQHQMTHAYCDVLTCDGSPSSL